MAGWDRKSGILLSEKVLEETYWRLFNYVFSENCMKTTSYKFGLIKSILDNLVQLEKQISGYFLSYDEIYLKFTENYWNLVAKYNIRQKPKSVSALEKNIYGLLEAQPELKSIDFTSIDDRTKKSLIASVKKDCRRYVIGALYEDFEGLLYAFDFSEFDGILIGCSAYQFMLKHKAELEKLNYYAWAKYLEKIAENEETTALLAKLDFATPKRSDLSPYREVLQREFETECCFYCGKKLKEEIHVDHFIPWTFMKEDNLWNFVLACPSCNSSKNNKLPLQEQIAAVQNRNEILSSIHEPFVEKQFRSYSEHILKDLWDYAYNSGYAVWRK